jgi:hypothetical protein
MFTKTGPQSRSATAYSTRKLLATSITDLMARKTDFDDDDGVIHRSRGDSKLPTTRLKRTES